MSGGAEDRMDHAYAEAGRAHHRLQGVVGQYRRERATPESMRAAIAVVIGYLALMDAAVADLDHPAVEA